MKKRWITSLVLYIFATLFTSFMIYLFYCIFQIQHHDEGWEGLGLIILVPAFILTTLIAVILEISGSVISLKYALKAEHSQKRNGFILFSFFIVYLLLALVFTIFIII